MKPLLLLLCLATLTSCRRSPTPNTQPDPTLTRWLSTRPSRFNVIHRLGQPPSTGGSGLQIWFYPTTHNQTLCLAWTPDRHPQLVYAVLAQTNTGATIWRVDFGLN